MRRSPSRCISILVRPNDEPFCVSSITSFAVKTKTESVVGLAFSRRGRFVFTVDYFPPCWGHHDNLTIRVNCIFHGFLFYLWLRGHRKPWRQSGFVSIIKGGFLLFFPSICASIRSVTVKTVPLVSFGSRRRADCKNSKYLHSNSYG